MRNRRLKRRLVATLDNTKFYNRNNLTNIIAKDLSDVHVSAESATSVSYDLKYLLALFNSRLLNYWFARRSDNLHITPAYFRQLPIFPADQATQQGFAAIVDDLLAVHAAINLWRERGYTIRTRSDGKTHVEVPYDALQAEVLAAHPDLATFSLYDALTTGQIALPAGVDIAATISSNVFVPPRYPTSLILRRSKLWLEVPDEHTRCYLEGYLRSPRWLGKTWDEIKTEAMVWEDERGLSAFFAAEEARRREILRLSQQASSLDAQVDEMVLDRERIMGSAPQVDEEGDVSTIPSS